MQRPNRTPAIALATIAVGLAGVGVSAVIYTLHRHLATEAGFASFCTVNATVNCDVVLTSRYARLLGVSVAIWAAVYYLALTGLALVAWLGARATASAAAKRSGRRAAGWSFLLACFGAVFSAYMAVVALAVIHAVCLMCGGLYLVAAAAFIATWKLRAAVAVDSRATAAARQRQDRWVMWGAAAATTVVLLVALGEAVAPSASGLAASEIAKRRPDFYKWYAAQPVVAMPPDGGQEMGPASAAVTIVEYSDFECGHCAALAKSLHDTLPRFPGQVRVIFHHFPLDRACNPALPSELHRSACRAAVAAECAGAQQRFWPYHDELFANQQRLDDQSLLSYADRVGLDHAQFEACLNGAAARERVARDVRAGSALGVESTPTWFINGRVIKGALEPELMGFALGLAQAPGGTLSAVTGAR